MTRSLLRGVLVLGLTFPATAAWAQAPPGQGSLSQYGENACVGAQRTITGSPGDDLLVGNESNDAIFAGGGADSADGGAGNDCLFMGGGADRGSGGSGRDVLRGESGNDRIGGGSGNDRMSGGSGRDRLSGGSGKDRIDTRDRSADRVTCGRGRDTALVDRRDRVAVDCERVAVRR